MLKPELSHFSRVRAIGGKTLWGSSFSTALTSSLAAHAMARLRGATPDMVKALLVHCADIGQHDMRLGYGTPGASTGSALPWECRPGTVTLVWTEEIKPGVAYYWKLPIAPSLRKTGKLKGFGALTAILNPHPMVAWVAGENYFSARLATAVQYPKGTDGKGQPTFSNLFGSRKTGKRTEQEERKLDHKWAPLRNHNRNFPNGVGFAGENLRVYARVYARDLYLHDMTAASEVPPLEAVFVLSLGTGDSQDDIYSEMRAELGTYLEPAVIDADIEVDSGTS